MALPSEKVIRNSIKDILSNADLSSLSSKKVRKTLEEKFGVDLTEKKQQIDDMLMQLINAEDSGADGKRAKTEASEDDDQNEDDEPKRNSPNGVVKVSTSGKKPKREHESESGSDDIDSDADNDSKPVQKKQKTFSATSTKNNISKPKSSDRQNDSSEDEVARHDDEALARKLHEEGLGVRPRSSKKPEKKSKKSANGEKATRRKGTSLYSQACVLSEDLASVMGTDRMARKDVVSQMWRIFKERNLMDPKNKQYVICDEQLEKVFKTKKFKAFGMMKFLKNHIKDAKLVQS